MTKVNKNLVFGKRKRFLRGSAVLAALPYYNKGRLKLGIKLKFSAGLLANAVLLVAGPTRIRYSLCFRNDMDAYLTRRGLHSYIFSLIRKSRSESHVS
jgi:hypothetical protein